MILRNVVISEIARTVGPRPEPPRLMLEPVHVPSADGPAIVDVLPPVTKQPLTLEEVATWLAVQGGETRSACASILADELTAIEEEAAARGFASGEAQGRAEAQRQMERLHAQLASLIESSEAAFEAEQDCLRESCVEIVSEVLAKVAGPLLTTKEAVVGAVTTVLQRVREGREVVIRVRPADLPILQQEQERLAATLAGRTFSFVADPQIEAGGCVVETKLGTVDGRLDMQLRAICETLQAAGAKPTEAS